MAESEFARGPLPVLALTLLGLWALAPGPPHALSSAPATVAAPAAQRPARDTPARRTGSALIRGVVVDGTTGGPIRRAAVSLLIEDPDREDTRVVATASDANGLFEFTGVPAGRVQVTAAQSGYFDYDNVWNGELQDLEWQVVAEGQRIQGVRIALFRGGVVAGRVLDEFGEPATGVEIEVLRRDPGDRAGGVRSTSMSLTPTTDDTGAFRVWGLAPGDYVVGARPNRFVAEPPAESAAARDGYSTTYYPGTPVLGDARAVRVVPGRDTAGVAFALVPVRLATVRGTVELPPQSSARGVTVALSAVAPQRLDGLFTRAARVRDDGSFELTRLAPGSYQVTARYVQTQGDVQFYGAAVVDLAGSDVGGVSVPLRAGATVRGHVVDDAGQPLNLPVMVSLSPPETSRAPSPRPARTYSDGSFRLDGAFGRQQVRAVEARLVAEAQAPDIISRTVQEVTPATRLNTTWWLKAITVNGRDVTDEAIDFDQSDAPLTITMTNRASAVRGTVSWNHARGGRRPAVVVFVDDDQRWTRAFRRVGTSEVDDAGRFDVRGLPPGDRYLAVAVAGAPRSALARPEMLALLRAVATPLRIDDGGTHELALTAVARPAP
ncbi:MAG: carboxypeptidase regulatory-like domain-containing protein [Acidobacteriota bacterium]